MGIESVSMRSERPVPVNLMDRNSGGCQNVAAQTVDEMCQGHALTNISYDIITSVRERRP